MLFAELTITDALAISGAVLTPIIGVLTLWIRRIQERDKLDNAVSLAQIEARQDACEEAHQECRESNAELKTELAATKAAHATAIDANNARGDRNAARITALESAVAATILAPQRAPLDPDAHTAATDQARDIKHIAENSDSAAGIVRDDQGKPLPGRAYPESPRPRG